ncbi:MAG: F0F1 ATP synthase subunit B [Treponema sp.]|nr:F0F1 ATP synthase subunit B [Treponema sp.]
MLNFSVTFIITIINIVILYFILRAVLFKPVTKFMAERSKRVQDSIEQAEHDRVQAKALLAQYETRLSSASTEADAIISKARERAQQEADRIAKEGRSSAEKALQNAQKQIEAERQAALVSFRKEAVSLVISASGRLLGRELKEEDNRRFAQMLLNETAAVSLETDDSEESQQ